MNRHILAGILGLSALAGGCASSGRPTGSADDGPAPVEALDWILDAEASDARLAYGVPASDDLRIGLECERGSGELTVTVLAPAHAAREILLESGGDTLRLAAVSEADPVHEGLLLTASARADEPVFLRFRRIGWLAVWRDGSREVHAAHPGSGDRIERFFTFCG